LMLPESARQSDIPQDDFVDDNGQQNMV